MKKHILLALAVLLSASSSFAQTRTQPATHKAPTAQLVRPRALTTGTGPYTSVLFNWSAPTALPPVCPASGTLANCYDGYTITDTDTGVVLATVSTLGPTATTYTWTPSGGLPYGTLNFSIVTNGYNGSGGALTSPAVLTSVTNSVTSLNGPQNFTGTPQ